MDLRTKPWGPRWSGYLAKNAGVEEEHGMEEWTNPVPLGAELDPDCDLMVPPVLTEGYSKVKHRGTAALIVDISSNVDSWSPRRAPTWPRSGS